MATQAELFDQLRATLQPSAQVAAIPELTLVPEQLAPDLPGAQPIAQLGTQPGVQPVTVGAQPVPGGVQLGQQVAAAPTQEELFAQLRATLPAAGSLPAPQEKPGISDLFTGASRTTQELEALPSIGDAPELNALSVPAFKSSLGLLTTSDDKAARGVLTKQFGDDVSFTEDSKGNTIVNFPSGQFALNKPGFSPQDLAKVGFDIAAFSPAAKAGSITKAALAAGGTEGLLETLELGLGGEFNPSEIVTSGVLGGFFKGAEDLIGAGFRAVKGKLASNIIESGEGAGIPVLTSDTLENQSGIRKLVGEALEKIPFTGTGGLRAQQQVKREAAVNDVAERYGQFSYEAIIDSLKTQKDKIKKAAGNVLGATGRKLDEAGEIPLTNTKEAIEIAKEQLTKPGVITSSPATRDLNTLIEAIESAPQSFTILKENRTAFNEILKGADKAERTQLTSRAKSLLLGVESAMKKDMTSLAKENLSKREFKQWNKANQIYAQEATKLTKTRLKNVLDKGDVTPESVKTLLFSQRPSEVKLLFNSLTSEGKTNARAAIISDVTETLGRRAGGLTPTTFANEIKKRGFAVNQFFRGEERQQLNGLIEVLDATRRAQAAAATTPTGQQLLVPGAGAAIGATAGVTPIIATLGIGLLGRVYESAPVRNALIRLANTKKGSTAFEQSLREATDAISVASQAAREQLQ